MKREPLQPGNVPDPKISHLTPEQESAFARMQDLGELSATGKLRLGRDVAKESSPAHVERTNQAATWVVDELVSALEAGKKISTPELLRSFNEHLADMGNAGRTTAMSMRSLRTQLEEIRGNYDTLGKKDRVAILDAVLHHLAGYIRREDYLKKR